MTEIIVIIVIMTIIINQNNKNNNDNNNLETVTTVPITSSIDYCNFLFQNIAVKDITKLQRV